jgi:hypothetical protein
MRRSTVLILPPQLVFPGMGIIRKLSVVFSPKMSEDSLPRNIFKIFFFVADAMT